MRRGWSAESEWARDPGWSSRRLALSGTVIAAGALILGLGLASLVTPASVGATGTSIIDRGSPETHTPEPRAPETRAPETDIADAAAVTRDGDLAPAPIDHLTIVQVSVSACGARSTGSGVVVADGLLLTAAHVVGDAGLVRIDVGTTTVTGEVLGVLADGRDIALVEVDAPMTTPLASGPSPRTGDGVTLVGHPAGGPRTSHVGPVVDVAPIVATLAGGGEILGVDVSITEGISGGAALDASGSLVGIVVAKETETDTALVVALPDLRKIADAGLVPGGCPASA